MASEIMPGSPGMGEICGNPKCKHADHRHRNGRCEVRSAGEDHVQCECTEFISPMMQMVAKLSWPEKCLLAKVSYILEHPGEVIRDRPPYKRQKSENVMVAVEIGSGDISWDQWVKDNLPKRSSGWLQAHLVARSKVPGIQNRALTLSLERAGITHP